MIILKQVKHSIAPLLFTLVLASCDKVDQPEPLGDNGKTIVKVVSGGTFEEPGTPLKGIDFVTTTQTTSVLDLRRDIVSNAELNKSLTVTVKVDTAMLRIYNDERIANGDAPYETMPSSWYSSSPSFTWGGSFTVTFEPGEFAKPVFITVPNAQLFDPGSTYGFPFTVVSADPETQVSTSKSVIQLIGAKNKYDGRYQGKGYTFMGTSNTTAPFLWSIDCAWGLNLTTTGANSVYMDAKPVFRGGSVIYFNGVFPELVFDLGTDKVTAIASTAPGNGYAYGFPAVQTPTYNSRYDESTKTIYVSYNIINTTWYATDTLVYCGPR